MSLVRDLRIMAGVSMGLGVGIGEVYFVVTSKTSADGYYSYLRSKYIPEGKIYTTVLEAYNATTAGRNDTVFVFPGAHIISAELAWSKKNTHLVGLGGPNIGGDYSESNAVLYCTTAAVASTLTVSGQNCQFHNFVIENNANNAGNLTAATVDIYGTYWKRVAFHGNMQTTQGTTEACASLYIGAAGMYPLFEDCIIGQDVWSVRNKANAGVLRFNDTGGRPNGGIFRRCQFLSVGTTATNCMVAIPASTSTGRGWLFDSCTFQHFDSGAASEQLNQCFYSVGSAVQKHSMLLHNCSAFGIDEWQDADDDVVISTMPIASAQGGLFVEPTQYLGE